MKTITKIFYFVCFVGLAAASALTLDRVVRPSISGLLLSAVLVAALAGAPGLVYKKIWPLAIVLLPAGAYFLMRSSIVVPLSVDGFGAQVNFYVEAVRTGISAYVSLFFPLNIADQPELRLVLALSVYCLVGTAAFIGLSLRKALPAIAMLLVLIGFSCTVDTTKRALWSGFLFLVLAAGMLVLSRGLRRQNWRPGDAVAGGLIGVVGAALALLLLVAAPSAVAQPMQDWRAWDPFHQGASVYTFNWLQNYPELLDPGNSVAIMSVQSSQPSYWKANSLDSFTGTAWLSSQAFLHRLRATSSGQDFVYGVPAAEATPAGKTVTEVFNLKSVYTNYLFVGGDPSSLTLSANVALRMNDMRSLHMSKALGPILEYSVTAVIPDVKPADVKAKGSDYPSDLERYLVLPFPRASEIRGSSPSETWKTTVAGMGAAEWSNLYDLNTEIVGNATDPYDKTLRIEMYLRKFFQYSLNPPNSTFSSPYAAFLFDTRIGYCQHFAGTMAMLLRFNGIPSRVSVGFTTGEKEAGKYIVTTTNAHAWVEVYFPEVGWVAFDPTPGRSIPTAGASSSSPGFVNPFSDTSAAASQTQTTQPSPSRIPQEETGAAGSTDSGNSTWSRLSWLPWMLLIVVVAAAWPAARAAWRRRDTRRGPVESRLEASLRLLRRDGADYGVPIKPAHTIQEVFAALESHVGVLPNADFPARAEAILFGDRAATRDDVDRAESLRKEVRTRLRRRHGWVRTGLTWYGVPRRIAAEGTTA